MNFGKLKHKQSLKQSSKMGLPQFIWCSQLCFGHPETLASFIPYIRDSVRQTHANAFVMIIEEGNGARDHT